MISVSNPPDFGAWRNLARDLLARKIPPEDISWNQPDESGSLWEGNNSSETTSSTLPKGDSERGPRVPRQFFEHAFYASAHRTSDKWPILYRIAWRLTHDESHLLQIASDPDVNRLLLWERAVRRELHKMTAFVRFKSVREPDGSEFFVAWYEPEHDVIALGAPFFQKRFTSMRWSILSPLHCVHWNGKDLLFTPGVGRENAPKADDLETLWRTYYSSIFNPARLNISAMQREMPLRYWKNLPETDVIRELVGNAEARTAAMIADSQAEAALPPDKKTKKVRAASSRSSADPIPTPLPSPTTSSVDEESFD